MDQKELQRKLANSTDIEGMVTCGECIWSCWHRWTWYCVNPLIMHEIEYATIEKNRLCGHFKKAEFEVQYRFDVNLEQQDEDDFR
jgi:hypothetical protein